MNPGKVFKKVRQQSGDSLRAFAARLGVSKSALSKIERGTNPPNPKTIKKFLAFSGYSVVRFCIESFEEGDFYA